MSGRQIIGSMVVFLFVVASAPAQDARKVIERAIEAQGGAANLSRTLRYEAKVKGTFTELGVAFTGTAYNQPPQQHKLLLELDLPNVDGNGKSKIIQVLNKEHGWSGEGQMI